MRPRTTKKSQYQPIISAFNTQFQDIQVQFVAIDPNQDIQQIAYHSDTAAVSAVEASLLEAGYLRDLTPLMGADTAFDLDDFHPETLQTVVKDGRRFLLPATLSFPTISYNKELFAHTGGDVSTLTWSNLLNTAANVVKQHDASHHLYGFFDDQGGLDSMLGLLHQADFFAQSSESQRLDRPEVVAALKHVAAYVQSGAIYAPQSAPEQPIAQLIRNAQLAAWPTQAVPAGTDLGSTEALGTIAMPPLPGGRWMVETGYIMSNGTQHAEEAWRWLSFLSRYPRTAERPASLEHVPARQSMIKDAAFWENLPADQQVIAQTLMVQEQPTQSSRPDAAMLIGLQEALLAILKDHQSVEQAVRRAQQTLDQQRLATPPPVATIAPFTVATPISIASAPEGSTSITFMANLGPAENQLAHIAEAFNQQNVGVFVSLADASQFQQIREVAKAADCFAWYDPIQPNEVSSVLDLQPLVDADAAFQRADYPPQLLTPFQSSGALYGLPYMVTFRVLIYNQTLFDNAGLHIPEEGWSPDEFLAAAQKLTNKEKGDYGFASARNMRDDGVFCISPQKGALSEIVYTLDW